MSEPPFDIAIAHRWFAVELNNVAWELIELPSRTAEEVQRMITAAHTSLYHWQQVGNSVHQLRAETLVAAAYLAAGWPERALPHAAAAFAMCEQAGDQPTQFDRACVYGGLSIALRRLDKFEGAETYQTLAEAAVANLHDAEEVATFTRLYPLE
ncbi:MAG TPA: hypothetical protein VL096_14700 [Pirellulaceae bacterium]|nr:hypothetical protein [Pirellulaceae bacterium]